MEVVALVDEPKSVERRYVKAGQCFSHDPKGKSIWLASDEKNESGQYRCVSVINGRYSNTPGYSTCYIRNIKAVEYQEGE